MDNQHRQLIDEVVKHTRSVVSEFSNTYCQTEYLSASHDLLRAIDDAIQEMGYDDRIVSHLLFAIKQSIREEAEQRSGRADEFWYKSGFLSDPSD